MEVFNFENYPRDLKSFLLVLLLLLTLGVVMVYSSSYIYSQEVIGDSSYFFKKQLMFLVLGVCSILVVIRLKLDLVLKAAYGIHIFWFILLLCTFIPGLGVEIKGSHRWLNLGVATLQPGEFIKLTTLLVSVRFFEKFNFMSQREKIIKGFILTSPLMALLAQPDFGTFVICVLVMGFVAFLSNFPKKYFYSMMAAGLALLPILIFAAPYRVKRLMTFLDPWQDPKSSGFQIIQSFLAFANGSFWGKGIGNSNEKLFYLPEAHNDFIFSVVGEELGFIGVFFVALLFIAFIYFGFRMAISLRSRAGSLLVSTLTFLIGIQAFLNMGVVLGLLPTKGLNLPFISYGGSSLLANLVGIGILLLAVKDKSADQKTYNSLSRRFEYSYR